MATNEQLAHLMKALTDAVTALTDASSKKPDDHMRRIDYRAIGGPPEWDSAKVDSFQEWQIKLQS